MLLDSTFRLPPADAGRESDARRIFAEYLTMSPEEWAARFSHTVGASSFGEFRYADPVLHTWIHELHAILGSHDRALISRLRTQYLTAEEIRQIELDSVDF